MVTPWSQTPHNSRVQRITVRPGGFAFALVRHLCDIQRHRPEPLMLEFESHPGHRERPGITCLCRCFGTAFGHGMSRARSNARSSTHRCGLEPRRRKVFHRRLDHGRAKRSPPNHRFRRTSSPVVVGGHRPHRCRPSRCRSSPTRRSWRFREPASGNSTPDPHTPHHRS